MVAFFLVGIVYNFTEADSFQLVAPAWIFLLLAMVSAPLISQRKARPMERKYVPRDEPVAVPEMQPTFRVELA